MTTASKTYDLKVEKTIQKSPEEVFRAIAEGRLFANCGADHDTLQIDFRTGGKYSIEFANYGMKNHGEFLEIIPNRKISFTWCQDYESNPNPDTRVSIELKDLGGKTALTLIHAGFSDLENKDAHESGWSGGLDDLHQEMANGKLRLIRKYPSPVGKLFELCKTPSAFFRLLAGSTEGQLLELVPDQKIVYRWKPVIQAEPMAVDTQITLLFESDDDGKSAWLELLHEGLQTEAQQKSCREGWNSFLKRLT